MESPFKEQIETKIEELRKKRLAIAFTETPTGKEIRETLPIAEIYGSELAGPNIGKWIEERDEQDREMDAVQRDIDLLAKVLSGEVDYDGTQEKFYEFQLEMGTLLSEIAGLELKKTQAEIKAHQQARLLKLLK